MLLQAPGIPPVPKNKLCLLPMERPSFWPRLLPKRQLDPATVENWEQRIIWWCSWLPSQRSGVRIQVWAKSINHCSSLSTQLQVATFLRPSKIKGGEENNSKLPQPYAKNNQDPIPGSSILLLNMGPSLLFTVENKF
ncbi:hypothetical protein PoB_000461000 [Plakobranchus ocellatus]|uniref:Uncharacterized protein n=1 Tax=Plakobranchus ocellatus TaxID=259542 RepID=A0AAV3Y5L4_9GAST|nr:hypothetical protein PoB_000461000 [Plakobranchus ocellatus]